MSNLFLFLHVIIFFIWAGSAVTGRYIDFWIKKTNFVENYELRTTLCRHRQLALRIFCICVFLLVSLGSISYFRYSLWICN